MRSSVLMSNSARSALIDGRLSSQPVNELKGNMATVVGQWYSYYHKK